MEPGESVTRPGGWHPTPPPVKKIDLANNVDLETTPVLTLEPRSALDRYKRDVHSQLIKTLDSSKLRAYSPDRQRAELQSLLTKVIAADPPPVPRSEYDRVVRELLDDILGFGPLEPLLLDPGITDIMVNGPNEVYVERRGVLELTDVRFRDDDHVLQVIDRIVTRVNRRVDESSPMVDARLPDGSRVNAIIPPLSLRGPAISIRRFGGKARTLDDLTQLTMLTPEMSTFLQAAVKARLNIVISGGTGSGKTTLLNALSHYIPDTERIITIEDSAELKLQQRHVLPLESRPANIEGKGAVTVRDLVRNCLRMRPDRIVVGECRGAEALDMLQAMNTGHDGSLTTLHANTPRDVLARLETMVLMAGFGLPVRVIRQQIAGAIDLIVQTNRLQGGVRRVTAVTELVGMEQDTITLQNLFEYQQTDTSKQGRAIGVFRAMGVRPTFSQRFTTVGLPLPADMFSERVLLRDF
jgi:pilus assembly protein CpaF